MKNPPILCNPEDGMQSALRDAFARQHSELCRVQEALRGLDPQLTLEVDPEQLQALVETCDHYCPRQSTAPTAGVRV
jgi:hypothetical protein